MQNVVLNNGVEMPILGFGVYQIADTEIQIRGARLPDAVLVFLGTEAPSKP
jgi:diketogulonate reductase-like aldo/keto reductase